ncbi:pr110 [rat cytomegalovirus strain Maastricht]|uniref:Pr110 n=1 Tax=Rat cytomegalovirus (strain Maastricht) TaxID=79700 RepID=Q9DW91_RCMVM|nr:pr110 [rat cytomegalovirus strain Maastricht]AAF99199.1 pr110 [rat cytomegalovirus strain Maastricht]
MIGEEGKRGDDAGPLFYTLFPPGEEGITGRGTREKDPHLRPRRERTRNAKKNLDARRSRHSFVFLFFLCSSRSPLEGREMTSRHATSLYTTQKNRIFFEPPAT